MNFLPRFCAAALGAASLFWLSGCQPQHAIVAEINNEAITDDVFYDRVQSVTTIPDNMDTDAGGLTMMNLIRDRLTEQLARKYHAVPSDETINAAADYQLRMDAATAAAVTAGKITMEELRRQKKFELEAFGIGTNGDKASEQEIDQAYNDPKVKPDLRLKSSYKIKILQVPDAATGERLIADLKKSGDFKGAAERILGAPTSTAAVASKEQTLLSDQLRPELRKALDALKPNEITPTPIEIPLNNPQQPAVSQNVYAVAQLRAVSPERVLTKQEARFVLEPMALQKTHLDWQEHYKRELADFTSKSSIRIALDRYKGLVDSFVRPRAAAAMTARPTPNTLPVPSQQGAPQ